MEAGLGVVATEVGDAAGWDGTGQATATSTEGGGTGATSTEGAGSGATSAEGAGTAPTYCTNLHCWRLNWKNLNNRGWWSCFS